MEAVYKQTDGRRLLLYDEGNLLMISLIGPGRNLQWGIVCKDYRSNATAIQVENDVYIAYMNLENSLCFQKVLDQNRVILALEDTVGTISDVRMVYMQDEKNELFVSYRSQNLEKEENSICIINPLGERKTQVLTTEKKRIETYEFHIIDGKFCLMYSVVTDQHSIILDMELNRLGDISLSKKILCKEKTMEELSKRCKETDREFQRALRDKEKEYEKRLKETTKIMEKRYKDQYDELAKLAKGMQEEGIKWREMYYKNVTKN